VQGNSPAKSEYVAIDFETANERRDSACALGIAVVDAGRIVEQRSWLIRPPGMRFNSINISIHGIRPADVENAPRFVELWPTISTYLEGNTVIAHNAPFDMGVLAGTLGAYDIPSPDFDYSCTCTIARNVWPMLPNHKLHVVAAHLGIDFSHHDACDDAMAAATIAIRACEETGAESLNALVGSLSIRRRRF